MPVFANVDDDPFPSSLEMTLADFSDDDDKYFYGYGDCLNLSKHGYRWYILVVYLVSCGHFGCVVSSVLENLNFCCTVHISSHQLSSCQPTDLAAEPWTIL